MPPAEDAFVPIPDWPGYEINVLGQVRNSYGLLSCDVKGRVRLRNKEEKRQQLVFVGRAMMMAGLLIDPGTAPDADLEDEVLSLRAERDVLEQQVNGLRAELERASDRIARANERNEQIDAELDKARETIRRGRELNGHLLHLVRQQQSQDELAAPPRKRGRKPRPAPAEEVVEPLNFEDWEW